MRLNPFVLIATILHIKLFLFLLLDWLLVMFLTACCCTYCFTINKITLVNKLSLPLVLFKIMAYSHCLGTVPGLIGPNMLYRNVHTGTRQGQETGLIVSCCTGPVPFPSRPSLTRAV